MVTIQISVVGEPELVRTYRLEQEDVDTGAVEYMDWGKKIADLINQ